MNQIDLADRVAVVTGGERGLGNAIAERLRKSGAKVCSWDLAYSSESVSDAHVGVDVANLISVEAAVAETRKKFGKIDILVNNAGIAGPTMPSWEYPPDLWRNVVEVNLMGVFNCCRSVLPEMIAGGFGRVVNIASIAGKEGNAQSSAYSATKGGVIALTKAIGKELAQTGVLMNAVAPAAFETEIWEQTSPEFLRVALAKIPMNRLGQPAELAALVAWLCSEDCSFSTGAVFDISGGRATY